MREEPEGNREEPEGMREEPERSQREWGGGGGGGGTRGMSPTRSDPTFPSLAV